MAFVNDAEFQDDFRKVGQDAIAGFEPAGTPSNPTEYASSENVEVAAAATEPDDLEDDEDEVDETDEDPDEDDLEDEDDDLDDDDDEDEEDDDAEVEDDDDEDLDDDDEDDDDDEEEGDAAVMSRLGDAEKAVRAR